MKKRRRNKGSSTIELAFLMPMILSVLILLIYLSAYLYNRQSIETIACIAEHKGLKMEHDTKAAVQKQLEAYINDELQRKLMFSPKTSYQVKVGMSRIQISIEMKQDIPFGALSAFFANDAGFQTKVVRKAKRIDPAAILWMKR